jgi:hypothetical protein
MESKYCDATSILLVNSSGVLKRLHCPFLVRSREGATFFKPGLLLRVDEVATNPQDELIYLIFNKPYHHYHFDITASF